MDKRELLRCALSGAAAIAGATATSARAQNSPKTASGPVLLTISGAIGAGNRGALDPALDQLMARHQISFAKAHAFDFRALTGMPAVTIKPTLEYDKRQHALTGPLLADVLKECGARTTGQTMLQVHAIDGHTVQIPAAEAARRRFILATHLDCNPMALGGLGPLWTVFDADRQPDVAAKPLAERFGRCPWGTYHIEVRPA